MKRHKRGAGEEKQPKSSKRKWKVTYQKKKEWKVKTFTIQTSQELKMQHLLQTNSITTW